MFTLHSPHLIQYNLNALYRFSNFWPLFFMLLYIVFLQHTFMNLFTSIFFEEFRISSAYEVTDEGKLRQWVRELACCKPEQKQPVQEDTSGIDMLKDKMKEAVLKRQALR